jgi:hypothetical protein
MLTMLLPKAAGLPYGWGVFELHNHQDITPPELVLICGYPPEVAAH